MFRAIDACSAGFLAAHKVALRWRRYGVGKWRLIQKDEAFGPKLINRSNVDLKVASSCMPALSTCMLTPGQAALYI
jgi:hypothetical protein